VIIKKFDMNVKVGKSYAIQKGSVLYSLYKSITIISIEKIGKDEYFYKTKEGFTLFSIVRGDHNDRWNIDNVIKILTLKEERKIKLDKLNKGRWWKIW
jgi:hypothetical protein